MRTFFWLPTVPYTAVDAFNRAALATGSVANAIAGAHADYNSHQYMVHPKFRRLGDTNVSYNVSYMWSGPNFIGRGLSLAEAIRVAVKAASRGVGGSALVEFDEADDVDAASAICVEAGLVPYAGPKTAFDHVTATMPWQCGGLWYGHTSVGHAHIAVKLERTEGISAHLFLEATSYEDWQVKIDAARAERRAR